MGRVCVSSCRCCVFASVVHPVAILSTFFCVICSLLMFVFDTSDDHMVEVQENTTCTKLDCRRYLHKLCLHNPFPQRWGPIPFFGASRPSLPTAWLALLLTKAGDVKSWPDDTNKHTPVIWICDLCHNQINKKQTSIRCNNTHWVHLKCTHIQQRQYKPDWRCTIHTHTQNVTTTPSTDNTTPHHKQNTTHSQTTINQRTKTSSYFK